MELLSRRQLETIATLGDTRITIHYGPYGCGKTFCICMAVGYKCMHSEPPKGDSVILVVGKTAQAAKSNICNVWASMYGNNFQYDSSRKDGYTKDATLFGHRIRIVGLNDNLAEARIRGINAYCIIGDELSTWSAENFDKLLGRLRGSLPSGWSYFFVGSTNPDSPIHWIKKLIDTSKDILFIKWSEFDNITSKSLEYYTNLKARYQNNPAYYARYVLGEWAAADGLVYTSFNENNHVLTNEEIKRIPQNSIEGYWIGVDYGLRNPSAILVGCKTKDNQWIVIKEEYLVQNESHPQEVNLTEIGEKILNLALKYNIKKIYIDPSAAPVKDTLDRLGIQNDLYENGENRVKAGIQVVFDLFSTDSLFISEDCKGLLSELYTYCYKGDGTDAVKKDNDHACDALRYMIMGERG